LVFSPDTFYHMSGYPKVLAALGICLAALLGCAQNSSAKQNPVTAIDVLLEPDSIMLHHAKANNARLLAVYPKGFPLDATHRQLPRDRRCR
jgi:hypothetical protein